MDGMLNRLQSSLEEEVAAQGEPPWAVRLIETGEVAEI